MILVDTNVWLALTISNHEFHAVAQGWLVKLTSQHEALFCRATQNSYLRLMTTAAVTSRYGGQALTNEKAWQQYERFLADPRVGFVDEPAGLEVRWKALAAIGTASPKMWMDAYLAAFAAAGGYQLVTTDFGFQQYAGLDCVILEA